MVVVAVALMHTATNKDEASRLVFASVMPLVGSWVGIVLAFYFSRENMEIAQQNAENLTRLGREELLKKTAAADTMIELSAINFVRLEPNGEDKVLLMPLAMSARSRHPVLDPENKPTYMVHQSLVHRFIAKQASVPGAQSTTLQQLTLADLLKDKDLAHTVRNTFATVGPEATLAEAKAKMETKPDCQDVFVTRDGTANSAVLGWLTNVDIGRAAKA